MSHSVSTLPTCTVIIPARLGSTRFPEKVLAARTGKPLVQHVVEGAQTARSASRVVVATDHERVAAALKAFDTTVVMTAISHPNGTSRLAEAAQMLGLRDDEIVVNAQGDEPEMAGAVIDAAVAALTRHEARGIVVGTVATNFAVGIDWRNPNLVKVARTVDGRALYFSRAAIPCDRDGRGEAEAKPLRHIGVYAYRVGFLKRYVTMASTPLERSEQLEQLRVLEHGLGIGVDVVDAAPEGIDTPEQYEAFVGRWGRR